MEASVPASRDQSPEVFADEEAIETVAGPGVTPDFLVCPEVFADEEAIETLPRGVQPRGSSESGSIR